MHLAIFVLLTVLGAALAFQLIQNVIPAGTPRQIMLVAVAAAAGLLLFDRIARASPRLSPPAARAPGSP